MMNSKLQITKNTSIFFLPKTSNTWKPNKMNT